MKTITEFNNMKTMVIVPHVAVAQIPFEYTTNQSQSLSIISIKKMYDVGFVVVCLFFFFHYQRGKLTFKAGEDNWKLETKRRHFQLKQLYVSLLLYCQ